MTDSLYCTHQTFMPIFCVPSVIVSMELADVHCAQCGLVLDRDLNAAIN
jgi:hypothetical protein